MDPLINISGLTYRANHKDLFTGLDLVLAPKERIGLTGPNGSGKTTLLQCIVGLARPTGGTIRIFGSLRSSEKDFIPVRKRIGFQFQDSDDQLFCPTVQEDVAFGPLNLGKSRQEVLEIVSHTLAHVGLEGFEHRVTHHLSVGEKRLVSLATVLAMNPDVLLLDEPTAGLDEKSRERTIDILASLPQALVVVSHDKRLLESTTDTCYQIQNGKLKF